jgi:hypothetical protein
MLYTLFLSFLVWLKIRSEVVTGMGIAALLDKSHFSHALVVLAQLDVPLFGRPHQCASGLVVKPGIGGEGHRFFLNRRIDVHSFHMALSQQLAPFGGLQGLDQHFLQPLRTQPLAPTDQGRGIQGQLVLKVLETAEVLPIGVLQKTINHRLITLIESMLQVVQSNHQPGRQTRTPNVLHEQRAELLIKKGPVDLVSELEERMLTVENLIQTGTKQIPLGLLN